MTAQSDQSREQRISPLTQQGNDWLRQDKYLYIYTRRDFVYKLSNKESVYGIKCSLHLPIYLASEARRFSCGGCHLSCLSHVYCLCYCLCLLFTVYCCPGQAAESGQLHVCSGCVPAGDCLSRLSGLTGVKLPGLGREAGPGARDFGPGHSGAASEVTRRADTPLVSGIMRWLTPGPGHHQIFRSMRGHGARIKLYLARGQYYTDRISMKDHLVSFRLFHERFLGFLIPLWWLMRVIIDNPKSKADCWYWWAHSSIVWHKMSVLQ